MITQKQAIKLYTFSMKLFSAAKLGGWWVLLSYRLFTSFMMSVYNAAISLKEKRNKYFKGIRWILIFVDTAD